MEQWRRIAEHPNYLVSNAGRVFSTKSRRLLKQHENSMGYLRVCVDKRMLFVHRLVAGAFITGAGEMVNHKDFNPHNNAAENLEWTDRRGNMHYSAVRGRFAWTEDKRNKIRNIQITKNGKRVRCLDGKAVVKEYECVNAVKADGHLPSMVSKCCNGMRKHHHDLRWEFA